MATNQSIAPANHADDVSFRAWGSEFSSMLTAVGLTQTADTGQINWTTVTYSSTANAIQGYEIWRFNDTLQSTYPIFLKFEYGTGNASTHPGVWITIGTGSNGSGAIIGQIQTQTPFYNAQAYISSTKFFISQACYNATYGFLGIFFKKNALTSNEGFVNFAMGRTVDQSTGLPNNLGVWWLGNMGNIGSSSIVFFGNWNWATKYVLIQEVTNVHIPGINSTLVSGGAQIYKYSFSYPLLQYVSQIGVGLTNEFPYNCTFQTALVGSTQLTYMAMGTSGYYWESSANANASWSICMLWQ